MAQIILDSNNNLIQGDFDNATLNNRTKLQTTTTNATTNVYVAPNGSATSAGVSVANNSSLTNASKIVMATNGTTDTQIISGVNGSGTYLPLSFYTNNALAMQVATSGNVGIGTASPLQKLDMNGTTARFSNGSYTGYLGAGSLLVSGAASDFTLRSDNVLSFGTGGPYERMRIDSSGNVLVGTTSGGSGKLRVSGASDSFATSYTSPSAGYFFSSNSADTTCVEIYQGRYNRAGLALSANNTGTVTQIDFYQTGTARGSISTDNSTTAYNTSSDYRLKDNIVPMTGALDKVALLKPVTYTWKQDGSDGQGFIAHELQEIVPNAVTGEKDAVETYTDEEGNEQTRIKPQGVDTSFLVATLTAAIQEQQTIINELKTRIEALESK